MKYLFSLSIFSALALGFLTAPVQAAPNIAERLSGQILLQVQRNGEAWYIYPKDLQRYYLGRPSDAFQLMSQLGLGVTDASLAKIPPVGSSDEGDLALRERLAGYILLQVQQHGEAWYLYPGNQQRYFLNRPSDAFYLMRTLGLGITNVDLAKIPIAPGFGVPGDTVAGLEQRQTSVSTSRGTFLVDMLTFDYAHSSLRLMTDTAQSENCATGCDTVALLDYVNRRGAVAGMHGTYFCPESYASCVGQTNFYYFPVYNSFSGVMINDERIVYSTPPMVAFDTTNKPYYFHRVMDFEGKAQFESRYGVTMRAAISNGPALVENSVNILDPASLDSKQATVKSYRGMLGWRGTVIYLAVVHSATVTDTAAAADALGLDYAINLDGGGSTAMYNEGRYALGPGRDTPNAILILP